MDVGPVDGQGRRRRRRCRRAGRACGDRTHAMSRASPVHDCGTAPPGAAVSGCHHSARPDCSAPATVGAARVRRRRRATAGRRAAATRRRASSGPGRRRARRGACRAARTARGSRRRHAGVVDDEQRQQPLERPRRARRRLGVAAVDPGAEAGVPTRRDRVEQAGRRLETELAARPRPPSPQPDRRAVEPRAAVATSAPLTSNHRPGRPLPSGRSGPSRRSPSPTGGGRRRGPEGCRRSRHHHDTARSARASQLAGHVDAGALEGGDGVAGDRGLRQTSTPRRAPEDGVVRRRADVVDVGHEAVVAPGRTTRRSARSTARSASPRASQIIEWKQLSHSHRNG